MFAVLLQTPQSHSKEGVQHIWDALFSLVQNGHVQWNKEID